MPGYAPRVAEDVIAGTAEELPAIVDAQVEPSEKQKQTKIWKHPDREHIETLIRVGKTPGWINRWLAERYPTTDEDGIELEDSASSIRWHVSEEKIEEYRAAYMPECQPGVEVVSSDLEDLIGRRLPQPAGYVWEVQVLETAVHVAEVNLTRALKSDEDLQMLQLTTLDANEKMIAAAQAALTAKSKLGMQGYEAAPERHDMKIKGEHLHLSTHLHGELDQRTGRRSPTDKPAVELLGKMLTLPPEERRALMAAASATAEARVNGADAE